MLIRLQGITCNRAIIGAETSLFYWQSMCSHRLPKTAVFRSSELILQVLKIPFYNQTLTVFFPRRQPSVWQNLPVLFQSDFWLGRLRIPPYCGRLTRSCLLGRPYFSVMYTWGKRTLAQGLITPGLNTASCLHHRHQSDVPLVTEQFWPRGCPLWCPLLTGRSDCGGEVRWDEYSFIYQVSPRPNCSLLGRQMACCPSK